MIPRASLNQLYVPAGPGAGRPAGDAPFTISTQAHLGPMMVIPGGLGAASNGGATVVTYPAVSSVGVAAGGPTAALPTAAAPSEAGPVSAQVNKQAQTLTELMREGVEKLLGELSAAGSTQATVTSLRLQIERLQWKHQTELAEQKKTLESQLAELRTTMEQEQRKAAFKLSATLAAERKDWDRQLEQRISETKKKQWCANCGKEAIFYCCWNTSYCDFPCQEAQWPKHMLTCANQQGNGAAAADGSVPRH
ncbi:protein kinase C-binding protein 1-like [Pollicipes pollicipes]|uniref:protein kinase C-binding protein 1-like n=1 Tax=Pollicipes pollicipes TaxID=41117 RepID=UPI0018854375|nr:protein kinase C-binding protein 1-like [Pollicipes pollicipes]